MTIRWPLMMSLVVVAAMAALSAWAWPLVPDAARIAVHFDMNGAANGFAGKQKALTVLPILALGLTVLLSIIPRIEPRRFNLAASAKFYKAAWIGGIVTVAVAHAGIVLGALHAPVNASHLILPVIAVLFMVIGNYMGKTRSNFFAGIRTPWTLSSEYSWEKTHRLTGRLFMLLGAATLVAAITVSAKAAGEIMTGGILASALVGAVASYVFWRRDPLRHSSDRMPE
ncbi:MAG: SdpI family protein [Alphaproteobacteria bacterium]|nr:SdpI family protein [Alphaproteobacteria bacterium]MDE2110440.1 SdpI family protein [Alphaproteobacteria bacterium]MDE2493401.1 SdpI family protein [Alphaproteobacteria bacterium]